MLDVPDDGVLSNDDLGDEPGVVSLVTPPSHAVSFSFSAGGGFTYEPPPNWADEDSFTYQISNSVATSQATVGIGIVNSPPWPSDDQYYMPHDTTLAVLDPLDGLKSNDEDYDHPLSALTVSVTAGPGHAQAFSCAADGTFTYEPTPGWLGTDTFTYTLHDGIDESGFPATVTIEVMNEPPTAHDDPPNGVSYATLRDIPLVVPADGVLGNDTDPENDQLTAWLDETTMYGCIGLATDGSFNYTPGGGYVGEDMFTYFAHDGIVQSEEPATVGLVVADLMLSSVTFDAAHDIHADPPSDVTYDNAHWLDCNLNGVIDLGDRDWPVAYTRTDTLKLTAVFRLDRTWEGGEILIRGDGPGNIDIPATPAGIVGTAVVLFGQATDPFPEEVHHYDNFDLDWEASSDGGTTWIGVGASSNDLYLTWADPQVDPLYHTVVHIGSHNANGIGGSDEAPVVAAIWGEFTDRDVRKVDNTRLRYYGTEQASAIVTEDLLRDEDGQCGAWAMLLIDSAAAQGINASLVKVVSTDSPDVGLLIKEWEFTGAGISPGTAPFVYVITVDAKNKDGMPGQGQDEPPPAFVYHYIVEYGSEYYDPSYGEGPFGTQSEWENGCVDGFYKLGTYMGQSGVGLAMKNDEAVVQTIFQ